MVCEGASRGGPGSLAFLMDLTVLRTPAFWAAAIAALLGVLLSQHVIVGESTLASIVGWILTFMGAGGAGHQVASVKPMA